ncbi:putative nucleic acid-binding protein [Stella humosa]|uniref:Ribonuclease VapC n=1 Tax=Stella humosa TaxID=94 RepID=A0A3N1KWQ7_9PROT|nr:PIN domain-containing protein [Stella humosa]ROP84304.1 putative nucleic acid-binding protein [Stella humosa]BBK33817.1 ribonuclease VapC [Stella humosa]
MTGPHLLLSQNFFDTNVLLYLISKDTAKAGRAEELMASGGTISTQVLNEFASVAFRKGRLSWLEIREVLSTIRRLCRVTTIDVDMHDEAIRIAERYRFSFYDALIVAAALSAGCSTLYTEDLNDGQLIEAVTVRNPFTSPAKRPLA